MKSKKLIESTRFKEKKLGTQTIAQSKRDLEKKKKGF